MTTGAPTVGGLKRLSQLLAGQDVDGVNISGGSIASTAITLQVYTVATAPDAVAGGIIYVSDGAAGDPILAFSDGTDWLRSDTGAAISAA